LNTVQLPLWKIPTTRSKFGQHFVQYEKRKKFETIGQLAENRSEDLVFDECS